MNLDKLSENRGLLIGAIVAGVVILLAGLGGLGYYFFTQTGGGAAQATPVPQFEGTLELPPNLEELAADYPALADILTDRDIDAAYKDFLIAYEEGGLEAAEALARQRGILNDRDQIRITVVVDDPANAPAVIAEMETYGVFIEGNYANEINIAIPILVIEGLAEDGSAEELFAQLKTIDHVVRLKLPIQGQTQGGFSDFFPQAGGITGEGVSITGADDWHAAGQTGQTIKVGVLDLGFSGYRPLLGTDLPATVQTFTSASGATDIDDTTEVHGTACAEIVYEMAPGVELYLAYYDGSLVSQSIAVDWLMSQGVQIISHSAGSNYGPRDGTGPDAELVNNVVSQGVLWINASGNEAESHHRAQFNDSDGDGFHNFQDGQPVMPILIYADFVQVIMNWDDWDTLTQDYDLYLYDENGNILAGSTNSQTGAPGDEAGEFIVFGGFAPGTVLYIGIEAYETTENNIIDIFVYPGQVYYPSPEHSLASPGDAAGSFTVGATELNDSLASYSSQGPTNDGRIKPDISAPAGVSGNSYGLAANGDGFDGTSAATPHVAGAAALVWGANPGFTADDVRNFLVSNAVDYGPSGADPGFGFGRLNLPAPSTTGGGQAPPPQVPTPLPLPTIVPTAVPPGTGGFPDSGGSSGGGGAELLGVVGLILACALCLTCGGGLLIVGAVFLLFFRPGRNRNRNQYTNASAPASNTANRSAPATNFTPATAGASAGAGPATTRMPAFDPGSYTAPESNIAPVLGRPHLRMGQHVLELPSEGLTIGRASNNSLPLLEDDLVSRQHAEIINMGGSWVLRDRGSANGTFVGGEKVSQHVLRPGDKIMIGHTFFTFGS